MSYGRFASFGIASAAGILGGPSSPPSRSNTLTNSCSGYYTFKPELDEIQKEKELKEQYVRALPTQF